jgi:hypothetical protein
MQSAERDEEEPGNQPSQATMQWGSPQPRSGEGAAERDGSGYLPPIRVSLQVLPARVAGTPSP